MEYVNFNDERIPIGKRKVAYVKWAMSKGTSKIQAQKQANTKFGFEKKGKLLVIYYGDINYRPIREDISNGYILKHYHIKTEKYESVVELECPFEMGCSHGYEGCEACQAKLDQYKKNSYAVKWLSLRA